MRYFSTFSGIGGFELGFPKDWQCVGFSEIDKYAVQIYQRHFPDHVNFGDITKIDAHTVPDFDLFVGGFPCQPFSISGQRRGFDDTRGTLFFEIARIIEVKRPSIFILENVEGLLTHDQGRTFGTIITALDELGYDIQWEVLNSWHWLPHKRQRVYILGNFRGTSRPKVFPICQKYEMDRRQIEPKLRQAANTLTANYWKGAAASRPIIKELDGRYRMLTPVECERLQGFPDGWTDCVSDTQRYKCLGNAVTVNVIREIISRLS